MGGRSRRAVARATEVHDEEGVALSGWLFADLLLGLMIVFLGAVTVKFVAPLVEVAAEEVEEVATDGAGGELLDCETAMSNITILIELPRNASQDEMLRIAEEEIQAAIGSRDDLADDVVFPFAMFFGRPEGASSPNDQGVRFAAATRAILLDGLPQRFGANTAYRDYFTRGGDARFVRAELFPQVLVCQ
jgi:hypothetical protein